MRSYRIRKLVFVLIFIAFTIWLSSFALAKKVTLKGQYTTTYNTEDIAGKLIFTDDNDGSVRVKMVGDNLSFASINGDVRLISKEPFELEIRDGEFMDFWDSEAYNIEDNQIRLKIVEKNNLKQIYLKTTMGKPVHLGTEAIQEEPQKE